MVDARVKWARVFCMYNGGIGRFIPAEHPSYFSRLNELAVLFATVGKRLEIVVNADCQYPPLAFDPNFFNMVVSALGTTPHLVSGGNEWGKNGFDPLRLTKPAGFVSARCSVGTDAQPFFPEWDFAIYETSRNDDFERHYKDVRDQYMGDNADPSIGQPAHVFECPVLVDEMIGIGDVYEPGRTTNDPLKCWTLAAGLKLMGGAGICAHLRSGIIGLPPSAGGRADRCVRAIVEASALPLGANAFGEYQRGNGPGESPNPHLPVVHHDSQGDGGDPNRGSLRTHAMIVGNIAHVIAPGPGPLYEMTPVNGWRFVQQFQCESSPSNVAILER